MYVVCVCVYVYVCAACVHMEARDGPEMLFRSHISCFAETGSLARN